MIKGHRLITDSEHKMKLDEYSSKRHKASNQDAVINK